LSPQFAWLGFRSEVKELLALADVVTLPSYYREGVPRVLLEAMALEKPIVTTDNVGCREVVESGKNGYLVPVRDSQKLGEAIERLICDDSLARSLGKSSLARVRSEFEESIIVSRVCKELYELDA